MTLKEAKPGMVVKVESIEASELKERLMSMGMVKGTKVKVLRSAPLGTRLRYLFVLLICLFVYLMRQKLQLLKLLNN